jgi:hypothetical protein
MTAHPSPLSATQLVDEYFIENRNRILEVAAFLDRIDRAGANVAASDFRMQVFNEALAALTGAAPDRLTHIQMLLSDRRPNRCLRSIERCCGAFDRSKPRARS